MEGFRIDWGSRLGVRWEGRVETGSNSLREREVVSQNTILINTPVTRRT